MQSDLSTLVTAISVRNIQPSGNSMVSQKRQQTVNSALVFVNSKMLTLSLAYCILQPMMPLNEFCRSTTWHGRKPRMPSTSNSWASEDLGNVSQQIGWGYAAMQHQSVRPWWHSCCQAGVPHPAARQLFCDGAFSCVFLTFLSWLSKLLMLCTHVETLFLFSFSPFAIPFWLHVPPLLLM